MAPIEPDAHLLQPVIEWARREPERAVAAYRDGDEFVDVTAADQYARIRQLAKGLIASGVQPGDRVALMSATRLEWLQVDYAILATGAATVPIYDTSSAEQMQWIIGDSDAVLAVVETPGMKAVFEDIAGMLPACREVLVIDEGDLDELARRGQAVDDSVLDARIGALTTGQLATIVYTSGTTGRPKGCLLTHGHLRTNVFQTLDALKPMLQDDEVGLLFLPLAHTLTKIATLLGVEWGMKGAFSSGIAHLPEEMLMVEPTMISAVPRIFEKVYNAAQHKAHAEGKGAIFDHAAEVAIHWSQNHAQHHLGPVTGVEHATFEPLVYRKIRAAFGGRLRFAFSGGGPLGERLTHFFNGVGVKVFEGYGLTETSPVLTVNRADAWKPGTVGRPLAGTAIRIADDGEILARGPQVFTGYWHNDAATAEVLQGGWFYTGDIGELDDDGFVRITGRKKELIVTAAGKNVAPAPLEDRIRAHPLISQAVVIGDGRPFVSALLTLDEEAVGEWASDHGHVGVAIAQLIDIPPLRSEIQAAIDDANRAVSRAESIREFAVLPHDLTIDAGELTPTLKVRREIVEKSYAAFIDGLYGT